MTNEEKDLLIAYRVDAGDIDPDGDVEAQFLEWHPGPGTGGARRGPLQGCPRGRQSAEAELRPWLPALGRSPVVRGRSIRRTGPPPGPTGLRPRHALRLLR